MTVTRPSGKNKGSGDRVQSVTQWMNAAKGLLLAASAFVTAVTTLIVALTKG